MTPLPTVYELKAEECRPPHLSAAHRSFPAQHSSQSQDLKETPSLSRGFIKSCKTFFFLSACHMHDAGAPLAFFLREHRKSLACHLSLSLVRYNMPVNTIGGQGSVVSCLPCSCLCSCWSTTGPGCLRASRRWARRRRPGPDPSAVQDTDAMCSSSSVT